MKISELWLKTLTGLTASTETLVQQLTMAGLEVSGIAPVAPELHNIVVGKILSAHPNSQRAHISVCQVDVGEEKPLTIICGGKNVRPELNVAVAVPGARLANGTVINSSKRYGIISEGMLCSLSELGLIDAEQQTEIVVPHILELPPDAPIGMQLRDYLKLDDHILEIELTPNRSDCLSALGLAREISTIFRLPRPDLAKTHLSEHRLSKGSSSVAVHVAAPKACPRYCGCVIRGLNNQSQLPWEIKEYLRRSQIRSISPIVDIANFVMLELGQPLHAFALNKIQPDIRVRMAHAGEAIPLLNGNTVALDEQTLLITDSEKPIALAGIMGSACTAVDAATQDIFLEAAFFNPEMLSGTARRYGVNTDASMRFERGVDYQLPVIAMQRAIELLLELCGGCAEPMLMLDSTPDLPKSTPITLRESRIRKILGIELHSNEIQALLHALHFSTTPSAEGWDVIAPSYRFDVTDEIDLIEEIARLYGYHNIPATILPSMQGMLHLSETHVPTNVLRTHLTARGYSETITYSFTSDNMNRMLNPDWAPIELKNPLSSDLSSLRTSLFPNLIDALRYNCNRGIERLRLFEIGRKFLCMADGSIQEQEVLAGIAYGPLLPIQWGEASRNVDFYDVKNDVEALGDITGCSLEFAATEHPAFHPGKTAKITQHGEPIGIIGSLHPQVSKNLDILSAPILFEISLSHLQQRNLPHFKELSRYPTVVRDLAFVLSSDITAQAIQQTIVAACDATLQRLEFFDVYQGKNMESGKKSIAVRLTFSSDTATLLDETINAAVETIVQHMQSKFSAVLRNF